MSHGPGTMQRLLLDTVRQLVEAQRDDPPSDSTAYIIAPDAMVLYPAHQVVLTRRFYLTALTTRQQAGEQVWESSHLASATRALRGLVATGKLIRVWPSTQYTYLACPCCGRKGRHPRGAHAFKETLAVMLPEDRWR